MEYSGTVPALPSFGTHAVGERVTSLLLILGAIGAGLVAAYVAATQDPLVAILLAGGLALVLGSLRWPLLSLFVFVALIPIEEAVSIAGVGTLSRWAGIAFACVYIVMRFGRLTPGALPIAGWAYIGWAVLSTAWALDSSTTMAQLQTLLQLAVIGYLIADVVIHQPSVIRPLLWTYSVSAAATAAFGTMLYLVGAAGGGRLEAISNQNPAQFATILLPALIFTLYEAMQGRHVVVASVAAALCTGAIALSGTRSVWLAATIVIFLLILPRLGIRRAVLAVGVLGAMVVATLQIPGVASLVADRTATAASTGGAGRTDIWSVGLQIFGSSPVIGVGYANFPNAFTPAAVRAADVSGIVGTSSGPHNLVVGTAGELGIVGLLLLGLFLGPLVLRRGWGPDANVVQAIVASLAINALFIDILGNRKQVWVAIGMAAGLAWLARRAEREAERADRQVPARPDNQAAMVGPPVPVATRTGPAGAALRGASPGPGA